MSFWKKGGFFSGSKVIMHYIGGRKVIVYVNFW